MTSLCYPCALVFVAEDCAYVTRFRDVPEATTFAPTRAETLAAAPDALGLALLATVELGRPLPVPSEPREGESMVAPEIALAAKIAFIEAFRASGTTRVALAERLGVVESEIRRMLDPDHPTKIDRLTRALAALGRRVALDVTRAA